MRIRPHQSATFRHAGTIAACVLMVPSAATAQEPPIEAQCELHVWPSEGLQLVTHNVSDGINLSYMGALPQAMLKGEESSLDGAPAQAKRPLSTREQVAALSVIDLPALLGLSGYRQIVHDVPLESRVIRTNSARHGETAAPCYADLVVHDVFLQWDFANGHHLKTFYRFRDFASGTAATRSFGAWVQTKLTSYKKQKKDYFIVADKSTTARELEDSFKNNASLFSQAMNNPKRKK